MKHLPNRSRLLAGVVGASLLTGAAFAATADPPKAIPPGCSAVPVVEGCGTFRFPDGTNYVGGFHGGLIYGPGVINFADGSRFETDSAGQITGPVTYTDAHGMSIRGQYKTAAPDPAHPHAPVEYPAWRALFGDSATVLVHMVVDEKGNVISAAVGQPSGKSFDRAALEAVMGWHYLPATVDDRPVKDVGAVRIQFVPPAGPPSAPDRNTPVFGAGQKRCSAWSEHRNDDARAQYVQWLMGFLSGTLSDVGLDADEKGLTGRMDIYCGAHPLDSIFSAAGQMVIEQEHASQALEQQRQWLEKFSRPISGGKNAP